MNTKQLKQKILSLAIQGKLVPQDSNDEPAIELLKRINPNIQPIVENIPFEIPKTWQWCKVKDISKSILYGVNESAKKVGEYKLLRITDIQNNEVNWSIVPYTNYNEKKVSSYLLENNDILFARTGATVGKSYLVKGLLQNSIFASYLIRVRTIEATFPQYVKYFFDSSFYWKQIENKSIGSAQPNVNGSILSNLMIPIPPLTEQHRVVEKIESLFTLIDTIEKDKESIKENINATRQKLLSMAIRGELVPQDPNDEPVIELLKRINPKFTPLQYDEPLPQGWEWCSLNNYVKQVTDFVASGSFASLRENVKYYDTENYAILVRTLDLQNNFSKKLVFTDKHGYEFLNNSNLYGGELVLPNIGSIGKVFIVPYLNKRMTLAPNSIMLRFYDERHIAWFYYFFSSQHGKNLLYSISSSTTQAKFNKSSLKKIIVPIPPLAEQERIVRKLELLFAQLDDLEKNT